MNIKFKAIEIGSREPFVPIQIELDDIHEQDGKKLYLCFHQLNKISDTGQWKWCELFPFTGKIDIKDKEIYAYCDIVRFKIFSSKYEGVFQYNEETTSFEIHFFDINSKLKKGFIVNKEIRDFEIIGLNIK